MQLGPFPRPLASPQKPPAPKPALKFIEDNGVAALPLLDAGLVGNTSSIGGAPPLELPPKTAPAPGPALFPGLGSAVSEGEGDNTAGGSEAGPLLGAAEDATVVAQLTPLASSVRLWGVPLDKASSMGIAC